MRYIWPNSVINYNFITFINYLILIFWTNFLPVYFLFFLLHFSTRNHFNRHVSVVYIKHISNVIDNLLQGWIFYHSHFCIGGIQVPNNIVSVSMLMWINKIDYSSFFSLFEVTLNSVYISILQILWIIKWLLWQRYVVVVMKHYHWSFPVENNSLTILSLRYKIVNFVLYLYSFLYAYFGFDPLMNFRISRRDTNENCFKCNHYSYIYTYLFLWP